MGRSGPVYAILFYIWNLVVLFFTLLPGDNLAGISIFNFPYADKVLHSGIFIVYAFLLSEYFTGRFLLKIESWLNFIIIVGITVFFSLIIEIIQNFIPGRNFEFMDIIFNFIGALSGFMIFKLKNYYFSR